MAADSATSMLDVTLPLHVRVADLIRGPMPWDRFNDHVAGVTGNFIAGVGRAIIWQLL